MPKLDLNKYTKGDLLPDMGKGTYVLILFLEKDKEIVVGRGGRSFISFQAGWYAYVGSAYGPGGLKSRISRHLIKRKKCVWHIDYLRKEAVLIEVWVDAHEEKQETIWADALINMKGSFPVEHFGNTDDKRSRTHLCHFNDRPSFRSFVRLVSQLGTSLELRMIKRFAMLYIIPNSKYQERLQGG